MLALSFLYFFQATHERQCEDEYIKLDSMAWFVSQPHEHPLKNKCNILMMPAGRIQVYNVSEHLGRGCVWFCESIWFITAI